MASWDIQIEREHVRITLRGTVGIGDAGRLRLALLDVLGHQRAAIVDCTGLEHLDCAAAQVLIAFASAMERRTLPVSWSPLPPGPREYLALTGLVDHFGASPAVPVESHS